jgi:hypothetical protein
MFSPVALLIAILCLDRSDRLRPGHVQKISEKVEPSLLGEKGQFRRKLRDVPGCLSRGSIGLP